MRQSIYLFISRAKIEILCLYLLLLGGVSLVIVPRKQKTSSVLNLIYFLLLVLGSILICSTKCLINLPVFRNFDKIFKFSWQWRPGYVVVSIYHTFLGFQVGINCLNDLVLPCGDSRRFSFFCVSWCFIQLGFKHCNFVSSGSLERETVPLYQQEKFASMFFLDFSCQNSVLFLINTMNNSLLASF